MSQPLFLKKIFQDQLPKLATAKSGCFVSSKAGHSSDQKQSRNPQVQFFSTSIKDQNPAHFVRDIFYRTIVSNTSDPL